MNVGMVPVFEEKFKRLLKKIENEYAKPKSERNKDFLKRISKEAKSIRKVLKECHDEMGGKCCPKCGEKIL